VRSDRVDLCLLLAGPMLIAFAWLFAACFAGQQQAEESAEQEANGNGKCYVCHPTLKTEDITTDHLEMDITCDACHGPCVEHMHDEMLMTEPDLKFGRAEVNRMCSDPSCHKPGEGRQLYGHQDYKDPAAVQEFFQKWRGRTRPNGRTVTLDSVCTDCHGTHNLDKATATPAQEGQPADWIAAFNGRNLSGWQALGGASWTVKNSRIVAGLGENGRGGDLLTEAEYEDYLLAVTFRTTRPIQAGIWLHRADSQLGPRIEVLDSEELTAFTASVWLPKKGLVLANLREDLVDYESWNTISAKVQAGRIHVWLNGEEIGAVQPPGRAKGRIGLHLEKDTRSATGEFHVREVLIQRLNQPEKKAAE
jgi:hypothetical protein